MFFPNPIPQGNTRFLHVRPLVRNGIRKYVGLLAGQLQRGKQSLVVYRVRGLLRICYGIPQIEKLTLFVLQTLKVSAEKDAGSAH